MTKRIFAGILAVSLLAVTAAAMIILGAVYSNEKRLFIRRIENETLLLACVMRGTDREYDIARLSELNSFEDRITYIAEDGTVLYDNKAEISDMENHSEREEIKTAKKSGTGTAIRESGTLSEMTVYCAKVLADGCIVRVSGTTDTVWGVIENIIPEFIMAAAVAFLLSGILAALITRAVIKPINEIDPKNPELPESYREITPLLERIKCQNKEIEKQITELSHSRKEFSLITENMSEGFIITDNKMHILSYNNAALNIFGVNPEEESQSIFALNRSREFRTAVETALSGKKNEHILSIKDKHYQIITNPVYSRNEINGAVMIILDITEKEEREKLRREFTSNVSHELKTPLTTIFGISDMLAEGMVKPGDAAVFAGKIHDEAGRMISLIDDIIRLSQMDENTFNEEKETVDLLTISKRCAERLAQKAEKNSITVSVTGENAEYIGIPSVLEEIIYNLLDNAIKYGVFGGKAEINIKNSKKSAVITVSDNGIGIPSESLDRVFERFYRVDKSRSRKMGGTGLGLSIVKHGTALHGGNAVIKSSEGKGTSVTVTLPKRVT